MINNPFKEQYRKLIDNPCQNVIDALQDKGSLMISLYYALDDALGKIYELEQTLEGRDHVRGVLQHDAPRE